MRDLRRQVPGGRRGGPKRGFGTAARGGLKQSFGAAAEAVAYPLLYQTREGLGDGESIANDVCVPIRREAVSSAHMLERCVLLMLMVPGIIHTLAHAVVKTVDQE